MTKGFTLMPRRMALWKGCLAWGPHSWVFTTRADPLASFSPGNPFFSSAKSRYTLPVRIPAVTHCEDLSELSGKEKTLSANYFVKIVQAILTLNI
jgi:hypothetical protein